MEELKTPADCRRFFVEFAKVFVEIVVQICKIHNI
jgi:hypothetical protein